ncbi:hypothetical protein NQ317_017214 [Molorchus minor]|uniref:Uncharacterized protein n=1 Tax=Molorchus minor TaxID=1323400 RepID=A0ABQ9JXF4_9CUCU|nr:hypothetical protein NQ317_017214 [Molorchus minor]
MRILRNNPRLSISDLEEKSKVWKSLTLWSKFVNDKVECLKNGVDVSNYFKVVAFFKRKNCGYSPKKSKTLTFEQVQRFINEAPDEKYLMLLYKISIYEVLMLLPQV